MFGGVPPKPILAAEAAGIDGAKEKLHRLPF